MRKNIILFIIFTLIVAGCSVTPSNLQPKSISTQGVTGTSGKYNPNKSITYNKLYSDLKDELLYARITTGDDSTKRKTVSLIKDKEHLVQIVREFDKLKSSLPQKAYHLDPKKQTYYVVTMWREGTSVSYVILDYQSDFYYREKTNLVIRKIPDKLVKLLGF
ncbi:MAG: hypothetical protein FH756_17230 [Firmicutes bacterium]|nr:hypothetical protein [Bacillota bacterium]